MRPLKIPSEGINRNCALKDRCVYVCKEDSQFEEGELNVGLSDIELPEFHFMGTAQ